MLRQQRLNDRLAGTLAAPGAAGDLRQQLERALGRSEVREAEADVGGDHADQRHVGKVVALGDHLRADQDVDFAARDFLERLDEAALAPHGIAIDARDARRRETALRISASTRSVPKPTRSMYGAAHFSQVCGTGLTKLQ